MSDIRTAKGWHKDGWRYHATSPDGEEALATTMAEAVEIAQGNRVCQITAAGKLKPLRRSEMGRHVSQAIKYRTRWHRNPDDAPKAKPKKAKKAKKAKKRKWKESTHTARVLAPRPLTADEIHALTHAAGWLYDVQIVAMREKDLTGFSNADLTVGAIAREPEFWQIADPEVIAGAALVMRKYRDQAGPEVYDAARQAMVNAGVDELDSGQRKMARDAISHVAKRRTITTSKTRANELKRVYVERKGAMLDIFRDAANKRLGNIVRDTWGRRAHMNRSNWHWEISYTTASEWQRFVAAVRDEGWTIVFPDDTEETNKATYSSVLELEGLPQSEAEVAAAAAASAKASGFEILGFRNLRAEHALTIIWPNNKPQSREVNAVIKGKAWGWKFGEQLQGRDGKLHDANSANLPYRRVFEVVKVFVEKGWLDVERANKTLEVIGSSYRIAEGGGLENAPREDAGPAQPTATVEVKGRNIIVRWLNDSNDKWGFQGAFKGSGFKWDWKSDPDWTKITAPKTKWALVVDILQRSPQPALANALKDALGRSLGPALDPTTVPLVMPARVRLYDHQEPGIRFLMGRDMALLADDMGLGKTLEAIIAAETIVPADKKVLVVCPASVTHNWAEEVMKWSDVPASKINILISKPVQKRPIESKTIKPNARWVIVSYASGRKTMKDKLMGEDWGAVIFDEAHRTKNTKTQNHKMAIGLHAARKWLLTGTAMQNRAADLWGIIRVLDHPLTRMKERLWMDGITSYGERTRRGGGKQLFKGWEAFMVKYADGWKSNYGWETKGTTNVSDLSEKMSNVMLRRTKDEVLDLPGKNRITRRTIVPTTLANKGFKDIGELSKLRGQLARAKAAATIEATKDVLEAEDKVVVFSAYLDVLNDLQAALTKADIGWVRVDGSVVGAARQQAVKRFQTDPNVRVFIGQIIAAGEGITLTKARTVIFNDYAMVPAYHAQAEDRIYRIGQTSTQPVSIVYMRSNAVLDEVIGKMLRTKMAMIDSFEGGLVPPGAGEIDWMDLRDAMESELRKNPRSLWR